MGKMAVESPDREFAKLGAEYWGDRSDSEDSTLD